VAVKRGSKALLIVGIILAALVGFMAIGAFPGMGAVRRATVGPVDLSRIADGTYPGSYKAGRFSYSVQVTVKSHRIEAVKWAGSRPADAILQKIFARIVEAQTPQVDTVSGASLTTKAASKAVEDALTRAR
jgi:uncharacterized protein with FMN-binding domain